MFGRSPYLFIGNVIFEIPSNIVIKRVQQSFGSDGKGRVNPTFVYPSSYGENFTAHWSCDSLQGFHLAKPFDGWIW